MCVKLANLPSKNTHHKQIDRPDRWCANDNIVAGTGDQDKKRYAGGPQDQLLSGNTISSLLVWVSHAAVANVWSTNLYLKYKFVPADEISIYERTAVVGLGLGVGVVVGELDVSSVIFKTGKLHKKGVVWVW